MQTLAQASIDPRRWRALFVVLAGTFMAVLDAFIVNVALPPIQQELHTSFAQVQLVLAGYTLAYAVGLITGGRLGDIFGRKRMFQLGMLGFTCTSLLCGLAPTPSFLIVSRVIQGLTASLMIPQVLSIIQVSFHGDERTKALGTYGAVIGIASILGQVVGGILITGNLFGLGWRNVFLVNVPIGIMALITGFFVIKESTTNENRKLDFIGVGLIALTLALFVFPLTEGRDSGWPLWIILCLLLSLPFFITFLLYERHVSHTSISPLLPLNLFQERRFMLGIIIALAYYGENAALFFTLVLFLQVGHGFSPLSSGLTFLPIGLGSFISSLLMPRFVARFGLAVLWRGAAILILGDVGTIFVVQHLGSTLHTGFPLYPVLLCVGLGQGLVGTPLVNAALSTISSRYAGAASGVLSTVTQISNVLGVAFISLIFFGLLGSQVPMKAGLLPQYYGQAFVASLYILVAMAAITLFLSSLLCRYKTGKVALANGHVRSTEQDISKNGKPGLTAEVVSKEQREESSERNILARREHQPAAPSQCTLMPQREQCPGCEQRLWVAYYLSRKVMRLNGLYKLTLVVRRCHNPLCQYYNLAYHPEEEGAWALPHDEFGLDLIALIGTWHFAEHRSVPEIHQRLQARHIQIAERTVTHLVHRYEELVTAHLTKQQRMQMRSIHPMEHALEERTDPEAEAIHDYCLVGT